MTSTDESAELHRIYSTLLSNNPRRERRFFTNDSHMQWKAIAHLMKVVLGWEDCGAGLRALASAAHLDRSPATTLRNALSADERLLALLGWAWSTRDGSWDASTYRSLGELTDIARETDFLSAMRRHGLAQSSGYDPYHLCLSAINLDDDDSSSSGKYRHFESLDGGIAVIGSSIDWAFRGLGRVKFANRRVEVVSEVGGWLGIWVRCKYCSRWHSDSLHHELGHIHT